MDCRNSTLKLQVLLPMLASALGDTSLQITLHVKGEDQGKKHFPKPFHELIATNGISHMGGLAHHWHLLTTQERK